MGKKELEKKGGPRTEQKPPPQKLAVFLFVLGAVAILAVVVIWLVLTLSGGQPAQGGQSQGTSSATSATASLSAPGQPAAMPALTFHGEKPHC